MLSKRITENRRLLTAAAAMRHRIITRSKPRVLRPVACLRSCPSSTAAAMFAGEVKEGEVVGRKAASRNFSRAMVHEHTFPTPASVFGFADIQHPCNVIATPSPARLTALIQLQWGHQVCNNPPLHLGSDHQLYDNLSLIDGSR
jgi:hypothetical protein